MKSGRISDVYSPKPAFVSGAMILALTHLGGGFVRQKIALLVLRALGGIGGALTIPSALSMIVALFPDQRSQGRAIAIFGGTGGIGNGEFYLHYKQLTIFTPISIVLGLIIGALFVQYTSWPWIFYFTAIMGSTIGITCFILIPKSTKPVSKARFDVFGIATLSCESLGLPCPCNITKSHSTQRPSSSSSSLLRLVQSRDGPLPTSSRH
jgi:MFS family permease